jgi:hypothetical protein
LSTIDVDDDEYKAMFANVDQVVDDEDEDDDDNDETVDNNNNNNNNNLDDDDDNSNGNNDNNDNSSSVVGTKRTRSGERSSNINRNNKSNNNNALLAKCAHDDAKAAYQFAENECIQVNPYDLLLVSLFLVLSMVRHRKCMCLLISIKSHSDATRAD